MVVIKMTLAISKKKIFISLFKPVNIFNLKSWKADLTIPQHITASETSENEQESSIVGSIFIISQLHTFQSINDKSYVKFNLLNYLFSCITY